MPTKKPETVVTKAAQEARKQLSVAINFLKPTARYEYDEATHKFTTIRPVTREDWRDVAVALNNAERLCREAWILAIDAQDALT